MVPKRIVAIVFPVFLVAAPACAQRVGNDQLEALRESHPDRREHCQLWRDKLPAASGRQEYRDVLHKLAFCDATGPDAFAAEWRNPSGRDVEALLSWSRLLRDRRLLEAALHVARSAGFDRERRLAAIALLGSLNSPNLIVSEQELISLPKEGIVAPGISSDAPRRKGTQPLPPDAPRLTYDAVERIAREDYDDVVRNAAAFLLRAMHR